MSCSYVNALKMQHCPTMRMSHEGERARDARIQCQSERASPHWLNPLGWARESYWLLLLILTDELTSVCETVIGSAMLTSERETGTPCSATLSVKIHPPANRSQAGNHERGVASGARESTHTGELPAAAHAENNHQPKNGDGNQSRNNEPCVHAGSAAQRCG